MPNEIETLDIYIYIYIELGCVALFLLMVNISNSDSFSKQALGSQWDRIRVTCRQPFRSDKQFGLSFIRVASVESDPVSVPPAGVSGTTATLGQTSHDVNDDDGIVRLKKASGLMGCLR